MPKVKKTRKFALVKRMLNPKDSRIKENQEKEDKKQKEAAQEMIRHIPQLPSHMFFKFNSALGPPYHILLDTNFINFSIQNKLDIMQSAMTCLLAKCHIYITDCVMAELEKLGQQYRVALRVAKDPRFERLVCSHKGTYADDCLVDRITEQKCYIVATCDRELKRRIRKQPGVPILYIKQHQFTVERMPDAYGAPNI